ncbi:RlmE family RNA methyltransferase [Patescibacteria group bacterium]|nr:RlmE family RNA methyltransferase [Patescibacteria group bacterium]
MYRKDKKDEFYTRKSKKEGYPARSVYKLKDMDSKYKIIKRGNIVMDLGSAPGSWTLYASKRVGREGRVLAVDIETLNFPAQGNIIFVKRDILKMDEIDLKNWAGKFDVVISDLAPKTSGIISIDVGKSLELSKKSFEIAKLVLKKGGNFVCKIFEGEETNGFVEKIKKSFKILKRARPPAVIKRSKEFYIVAKEYR